MATDADTDNQNAMIAGRATDSNATSTPVALGSPAAWQAGWHVTLVGIAVNVVLVGLKLLAGVLGHSQALIADAVHSVSDFVTDAVVLVGLKAGRQGPDDRHHFGHGRIETLAAAGVAISLLAVAGFLAIDAGRAIYDHRAVGAPAPTWLAVAAAAVSVLLKEVLYRYTYRVGREVRSSVIIANAWHHRSDAFSSIAVLVGVVGAQIKPEWRVLDAFATIVVAVLIVKVGIRILWDSVKEFTDTAPPPDVVTDMRDCARDVSGVMDAHDLRVRTVGGLYQMDIHVEVDGRISVTEGHRIAEQVERRLKRQFETVSSVIVHVDPAPHSPRQAAQSGGSES